MTGSPVMTMEHYFSKLSERGESECIQIEYLNIKGV